MPTQKSISIAKSSDIEKAYRLVFAVAKKIGFPKVEIASIVNAVSEIAGNVIKHATRGSMRIRISKNKRVLEIVMEDEGPGIHDVEKALRDGFSTKGGFGIGLGAAKRAMDEFAITSRAGKGSKILMKRYLSIPDEEISYGVISVPKPGEFVNGDSYVIREFDGDSVLLAVIDGEGHGEKANNAMMIVKNIIEEHFRYSLDIILMKCHEALFQENGRRAVVGLCKLLPNTIEYLGIGDTDIMVVTKDGRHMSMMSRLGQLGRGFRSQNKNERTVITKDFLPTLTIQKFPCPRKVMIILWSDGIQRRFRREDLRIDDNAQKIASAITNRFTRGTDDATVLVAKRAK